MVRRFLVTLVAALLCLPIAGAFGAGDARLRTDKERYRRKQPIEIVLRNTGNQAIRFQSPWRVVDHQGDTVARFFWSDGQRTLAPGARKRWIWDSTPNDCGSDGACTQVGGYVRAGRYTAVVRAAGTSLRARFYIGRYFTLGFRCGQDPDCQEGTFVVFVAKHRAMRRMAKEAKEEDKTLIVSGIVRGGKRYNRPWSYTMGPRSIVLGEVFTETCDASPQYVEENRQDWMGERWCPWSSYVKKVGR
jgi:hypothetical protein